MLPPDSQPEDDLTQRLASPPENNPPHPINLKSGGSFTRSINFPAFWASFRLFPWKFDEYIFTHWYLFTIGLEGVLLLLAVIEDVLKGFSIPVHNGLYYFLQDFSHSVTHALLTDWIYLAGVISIGLIAIAFNQWRKSIPAIFQELLSHGRISSRNEHGNIQQEYFDFLNKYQQALLNKKRSLLLGVVFIVCLVFTWGNILTIYNNLLYYGSILPDNPLLGIRGFISVLSFRVIGTVVAVFLEGYVFAIASWALATTGKYVRNLALQFKFNIQPSHPDRCGGFRMLGAFSFGIASPLLILSLLLGFYIFIGFTTHGKSVLEPIISQILLPFTFILAVIAFFIPLWDIHRQMVERKKEYEDLFAEWNTELESAIQSSFENQNPFDNQALEKAKTAKEGREILQALHPDKVNYPVWPFDLRILITFLASQIPAILSILSYAKTPLIEMLKQFFSL